MARKNRVFIENNSLLVVLSAKEEVFCDSDDFLKAIDILKKIDTKELCIHSFSLIKNEIYLYLTPKTPFAVSKFLQSFGSLYSRYFNKKYQRVGTIWAGRFKSSLVEDLVYGLLVMRYVEKMPLVSSCCDDLSSYLYSSFLANTSFVKSEIELYPHTLYKALGSSKEARALAFALISKKSIDKRDMEFISSSLQKQNVIGGLGFIKNIKKLDNGEIKEKKSKKERGKSMYKKLVVLDRAIHKGLKIKPMEDLAFAKELNFVPLLVNEMALVSEDFPVVFSSDESSLITLVSVGGSNLALDSKNKWIKQYVPLNLRKYPFAIANVKDNPNQKIILIDEESYLVNKDVGFDIFGLDGETNEMMTNAIEFLKNVDKEQMLTNSIVEIIRDSGILEDREITIGEGDEKRVLIKGFKVVNKKRYLELSDEVLASWARKGIVSFVENHLKSLNNIEKLFDLASQNQIV